ncbi:MAG: M1 family metallopeptidase [Anaerolineae bacterium]|nr:M1 family metallopeptidase [Anaerolineae bacterium]
MCIKRTPYPLLLLLLTACAFTRASEPAPAPTPTSVRIIQTTLVPTFSRQVQAVPSVEIPPTATPGALRCEVPADARTGHQVIAEMDYASRSVIVHQQIDYINRTGGDLTQIIFNVRPNSTPQVFSLQNVTQGSDTPLTYELTGQRLMLELPQPLPDGCALAVKLSFSLQIPPMEEQGRRRFQGYLGYSARQVNLGHWLPVPAPRIDQQWVTRDEATLGEYEVLDEADWDVTLTVTNAPPDVQLAAPGTLLDATPGSWRYQLKAARDFSLSLGQGFNIVSSQTAAGVTVEVYTYADAIIGTDSGPIDTPAFALDVAANSLSMYSDLFGAYPYERLVLVQADFPDGMEFSGLVFVGGEYFRGFGGPNSYLMLITVHEVAHQWWYNLVGNDQALAPWLDESLATYSEYIFIEEYFPALKDWWWSFRVDNFSPEGFVDSNVYEFESRRAYINAVYLRGVRMLNELRTALGTDVFFDWLSRYAVNGAGRIMTPETFWSLLTPEQFETTAAIRQRYLRQPEIILIRPDSSS